MCLTENHYLRALQISRKSSGVRYITGQLNRSLCGHDCGSFSPPKYDLRDLDTRSYNVARKNKDLAPMICGFWTDRQSKRRLAKTKSQLCFLCFNWLNAEKTSKLQLFQLTSSSAKGTWSPLCLGLSWLIQQLLKSRVSTQGGQPWSHSRWSGDWGLGTSPIL